ncbi:MAG: cytochrome c oxidase assembly protein [Streptosporangiales bacterium]|nr:cytochrome c oxidase assembly protein [Streptosporangiales bacterium]MBO0890021.1 cytochrome c oxidase assembly protein [Acidothermales bacterium]
MGGMRMLPPLTWSSALGTWGFAPVGTLLLALATAAYVAGMVVVARRGVRWPAGRLVAFLLGVVMVAVALQSAIDAYAATLYWMHMVQHLMLIMLAPGLLVLGRPLTLLRDVAGRVEPVLRGRVVAAVTIPGLTLVLYAVVLIGTHLTSFMYAMRTRMWLHDVEIVAYLVAGYLFLLTILATEPIRWQPSYPVRVVLTLVGMGADTVVGVVLMMTANDPLRVSGMMPRDWGPSPLDDLHAGGAVMWAFGDGLMLVAMLVVTAQWFADKTRRDSMGSWLDAARRGAVAADVDATSDVDEDEAALDAYNRMLASLQEREHRDP